MKGSVGQLAGIVVLVLASGSAAAETCRVKIEKDGSSYQNGTQVDAPFAYPACRDFCERLAEDYDVSPDSGRVHCTLDDTPLESSQAKQQYQDLKGSECLIRVKGDVPMSDRQALDSLESCRETAASHWMCNDPYECNVRYSGQPVNRVVSSTP